MRALLLTLLSLASACANQHRYFAPRENRNGEGPDGQPAAVYAVQGDGVDGEVRVWSAGSSRDGKGDCTTAVHLGFELENTGHGPLQLDLESLRCDELRAGDQLLGPLRAVRITGSPEAAPGTTARLEAWFEPGPVIKPREVDSFAARFFVRSAELPLLHQVTPFVPHRAEDPWRDDRWRWGFGFGFGWHRHSFHHGH